MDLGQHFLTDKLVLDKEIEVAQLSKRDNVIEIGAGKGVLTKRLAEKAGKVLAFEIDKKLDLSEIEKTHKNLKVVYGDTLKFSWKGYNKIVSNIPYHLSEPIIRKTAESDVDELILIVGENFKEVISQKDNKTAILVNAFFDVFYVMKIGKDSFSPKPRVNSWLIKLRRKKASKTERIIQRILLNQGKLKNAIVNALTKEGLTKRHAKDTLRHVGLHESVLNKPIASVTGKSLLQLKTKLHELLF